MDLIWYRIAIHTCNYLTDLIWRLQYRPSNHQIFWLYGNTISCTIVVWCHAWTSLFIAMQIASKEGYLTKLGYHRKVMEKLFPPFPPFLCYSLPLYLVMWILFFTQSWLTRWFVLYKNELSYYKNREVWYCHVTFIIKSTGPYSILKLSIPITYMYMYIYVWWPLLRIGDYIPTSIKSEVPHCTCTL